MYTSQYQLSGLTCEACLKITKKRVGSINGVNEVAADLNGNLEIKADRAVDKSEVVNALKDTDYKIQ
jgi:copper chaperone CopZ